MDAQLGWAVRPGQEDEEGSQHSFHGTEVSIRSLHSQKSKQSLRSLRSRERQSTGDRSSNGQGRCATVRKKLNHSNMRLFTEIDEQGGRGRVSRFPTI